MPRGEDGRYHFPEGFHMARLYPVEGESAIAELWFGEAPWAQITLIGVDQDALTEDRTANARFAIDLYPPAPDVESRWWSFDLIAFEEQIGVAKEWLLENEAGRTPIDREGLTAAGSAYEKVGDELHENDSGEQLGRSPGCWWIDW